MSGRRDRDGTHEASRAPRTGAGSDAVEPDPRDEELAVRTIELDTEDGGTVVLAQQNQAGRRQAGGGEWKNADHGPTPDEAARAQAEVDASTDAPVTSPPSDDTHATDAKDPDDDAADHGRGAA